MIGRPLVVRVEEKRIERTNPRLQSARAIYGRLRIDLYAPITGQADGLEAVLTVIKGSCDQLVHSLDRPEPKVHGRPTKSPGGSHFTSALRYSREGLPDFKQRGEEWDCLQEEKLAFYREMIWNGADVHENFRKDDAEVQPVEG